LEPAGEGHDVRHEGEGKTWTSFWSSTQDGLKLHARDYGHAAGLRLPVVCLPGLSRTSADFHELAVFLSTHAARPRRVLSLDYRGRGRSDYDRNPANYDIRIEAQDTLDVLAAAGIPEAVLIGTSRGGLIAMAISAMRPTVLKGVVLNDIGPVIEGQGLARIKAYVGKLPQPATLDEGVAILRRVSGGQFTRLTDSEWRTFAERTWKETNGRLAPDYDTALMQGLAALDIEKPLPNLWPYFEGLANVPVLAIRGGTSDMLSDDTLKAMGERLPDCQTFTVVGEGHAPLLSDPPTMQRIASLVLKAEDRPHAG
jgi:pimeloyl-ACP methyl ester carboxylesterase